MLKLFNQPYPTEESVTRRLVKACAVGAFVGLFLLIFQPFNLNEWQTDNKPVKILGFGVVTALVMLANYFLLPALSPRYFSDDRWTVGKGIVRVLGFVMVIAVGNLLYISWLLATPLTVAGLAWAMGVTFLLAVFPITGLILLDYIRQLKKYSQGASVFPVHVSAPAHLPDENGETAADTRLTNEARTVLTLVADNEKETLIVPANELLFIESSDNYCTVIYRKNDQTAKPLLRSSLARLEKQIAQPRIVRCHRSFVVNLDRVERVTGNAQGYKLHLADGQFQIPVARQYNETLVSELKAL